LTGTFEHHDAARVAAEAGDVVADPLQGEHDVEHADVARVAVAVIVGQLRQVQVAKRPEPVIDRHHHGVAPAGQARAVVQRP
jgi:hypothetical protein